MENDINYYLQEQTRLRMNGNSGRSRFKRQENKYKRIRDKILRISLIIESAHY